MSAAFVLGRDRLYPSLVGRSVLVTHGGNAIAGTLTAIDIDGELGYPPIRTCLEPKSPQITVTVTINETTRVELGVNDTVTVG